MNLLDHIKEEHDSFKEKMEKVEAATGDRKKDLFRELYAEIHGHHEAEEAVLFSMVKEKADEKALEVVLEMIEEHSLGSYQFSVLERTSVSNDTWDAKFSVLKEVLNHHMKEEEKEFLPLAKKVLSKDSMGEILEKFETVHEEKMKEKTLKLR